MEKLSRNSWYYPSEVSFEVQYFQVHKVLTLDKDTGEFSFSEENYFSEFDRLETKVIRTQDCRTFEDENVPVATMAPAIDGTTWVYMEDYMNSYLGATVLSHSSWYGAQLCFQNPEVLRATGTIYLNP